MTAPAGSTSADDCQYTACSAGMYRVLGQCHSCPAGQYQPSSGSTACLKCAPGQHQGSTQAVSCDSCPPGRSQATEGESSCLACAAGTFQPDANQTTCSSCPANEYSGQGATACFAGCSPGKVTVKASEYNLEVARCERGRFTPYSQCYQSPVVTQQWSGVTADSCASKCASQGVEGCCRYYTNNDTCEFADMTGQDQIVERSLYPGGSPSTLTLKCDPPVATASDYGCVDCATGYYQSSAQSFESECFACTACGAGDYVKPGDECSTVQDRTCSPCPAGTRQPIGSVGAQLFDNVNFGGYSVSLPAGTYHEFELAARGVQSFDPPSSDGISSLKIFPGYNAMVSLDNNLIGPTSNRLGLLMTNGVTNNVAKLKNVLTGGVVSDGNDDLSAIYIIGPPRDASSCLQCATCPSGRHVSAACSDAADTQCSECPAGRYQNSNTFTGTECSLCPTCGEGQYMASPCTNTAAPVCTNCPGGTFQASATFTGDSCTVCASCADAVGMYTSVQCTASTGRVCTPCGAGSFSTNSSDASCTTCSSCAAGEFGSCSASRDTQCESCPSGRFQASDSFVGTECSVHNNCSAVSCGQADCVNVGGNATHDSVCHGACTPTNCSSVTPTLQKAACEASSHRLPTLAATKHKSSGLGLNKNKNWGWATNCWNYGCEKAFSSTSEAQCKAQCGCQGQCIKSNPTAPVVCRHNACAGGSCCSHCANICKLSCEQTFRDQGSCGSMDNGCGGALQCGACGNSSTCETNACVCAPQTCAAIGAECGTPSDACGGTLDCGTCSSVHHSCVNHICKDVIGPVLSNLVVTAEKASPWTGEVLTSSLIADNVMKAGVGTKLVVTFESSETLGSASNLGSTWDVGAAEVRCAGPSAVIAGASGVLSCGDASGFTVQSNAIQPFRKQTNAIVGGLIFDNHEYQSGEATSLGWFKGLTLDECAAKCIADPQCLSFDHSEDSQSLISMLMGNCNLNSVDWSHPDYVCCGCPGSSSDTCGSFDSYERAVIQLPPPHNATSYRMEYVLRNGDTEGSVVTQLSNFQDTSGNMGSAVEFTDKESWVSPDTGQLNFGVVVDVVPPHPSVLSMSLDGDEVQVDMTVPELLDLSKPNTTGAAVVLIGNKTATGECTYVLDNQSPSYHTKGSTKCTFRRSLSWSDRERYAGAGCLPLEILSFYDLAGNGPAKLVRNTDITDSSCVLVEPPGSYQADGSLSGEFGCGEVASPQWCNATWQADCMCNGTTHECDSIMCPGRVYVSAAPPPVLFQVARIGQ